MILVPHSLMLLRPVSVWRTSILHHPEHLCTQGRWPGSWHWGPGSSSPCLQGQAPAEWALCLHAICWGVKNPQHVTVNTFEFLFRLLKMEERKKGKSRKQNKKAWEEGSRGHQLLLASKTAWPSLIQNCVLFKQSEPSLFQFLSQDLVSCRGHLFELRLLLDSSLGFNFLNSSMSGKNLEKLRYSLVIPIIISWQIIIWMGQMGKEREKREQERKEGDEKAGRGTVCERERGKRGRGGEGARENE